MTICGPVIELSNGRKMPQVGLGTWQSKIGEVGNAVRWALDDGYRLIDTAQAYKNEEEIGKVLHEYMSSGKLKRDDVFITTKLWCNHSRPAEMENELRTSLSKLQLDYVDLYLSHVPTAFDVNFKEQDPSVTVEMVWQGLEKLVELGLTKAIGVSNYSVEQMKRIQKIAKIKIHNVQVECYLYWPQNEMVEYCKKEGISFTAYAPLGSPGRVNWTTEDNVKVNWPAAPDPMKDETVVKLAGKYHKTPAQILIRHLMQRGLAVIPKSVNEKRIKENFNVFDFSLSDAEMKELNEKKHRQRLFLQDFMEGHPEDPFKSERK